MNRTERLLKLIASLVDAKEPVTFSQICEWFPDDYDESKYEASIRKFERDKAQLKELGVAIKFIAADEDGDNRYALDRAAMFLPDLGLSPDEYATLYLAGQGVLSQGQFPYHNDLKRGLEKIAMRAPTADDRDAFESMQRVLIYHPVSSDSVCTHLTTLQHALTKKMSVRMRYHTQYTDEVSERIVDPYGLSCRRGKWLLVGYAHEREDIRVYSVGRIGELSVHDKKAGSFEVPGDFDLRDYIGIPQWRFERHEPMGVTLDVDPEYAWMVAQKLGVPFPADEIEKDGPWTRMTVEVGHAEAFVDWLLGLGPKVRIVEPDAVKKRLIEHLSAIANRQSEAP